MINLHMKLTANSIPGLNVSIKLPRQSRTALGYPFKPSLNDTEGGGGETWMMERMEQGREITLDPAQESLKPSEETTKTSRVLGLSIVETKRFTTSHERAHQE
ncbi:hypothetical protein Bca4012_047252 [Brassica carinata]